MNKSPDLDRQNVPGRSYYSVPPQHNVPLRPNRKLSNYLQTKKVDLWRCFRCAVPVSHLVPLTTPVTRLHFLLAPSANPLKPRIVLWFGGTDFGMRRKGRRPHLKPVIGSGLKTDTGRLDLSPVWQPQSISPSSPCARPPELPWSEKQTWNEKCFPGLHLGPRARSPRANQQHEQGARGRSEVCLSQTEEKKNQGTGAHLCRETGEYPAEQFSCFAGLKESIRSEARAAETSYSKF